MQACDVEEPEVRFNIDQYSDVIMIAKPVIYISVGEIVDTHSVSEAFLQACNSVLIVLIKKKRRGRKEKSLVHSLSKSNSLKTGRSSGFS